MRPKNSEELLAACSFLLGKTHCVLLSILDTDVDERRRLQILEDFEMSLREDINRLFYANLGVQGL